MNSQNRIGSVCMYAHHRHTFQTIQSASKQYATVATAIENQLFK